RAVRQGHGLPARGRQQHTAPRLLGRDRRPDRRGRAPPGRRLPRRRGRGRDGLNVQGPQRSLTPVEGRADSWREPQAKKANPSRGGDAKPEVSQGREIARLPSQRTTWRSIVTIGMNLRKLLSGSTLALALAASLVIVPAGANADVNTGTTVTADHVCNIN